MTDQKEETEELRQNIARIIRSSKPPKTKLTREEFQALKNLEENANITIMDIKIHYQNGRQILQANQT